MMKYFIAFILILSTTARVQAGFVITTEQSGNNQTLTEKMYLNPDRMRVEVIDGKATQWMIYRDDLKKVWVSEGSANKYMELSEASLKQLKSQMAQVSQAMKEQLAQLPPDQREMIEKTMQQMGGEDSPEAPKKEQPKFVKQKSGVLVSSWTTDYYVGSIKGKKTDEVWTVSKSSFPVDESSMAIIQKFTTMMSTAAKEVFDLFDPEMDKQKDGFQGWPVQLVEYDETGKVAHRMLMKSAEKKDLPASLFEIPVGAKKVANDAPAEGF